MKILGLTLCFSLCALFLGGCATGPRAPFMSAQALFFSNTIAPLTTEYNNTSLEDLKCGEASTVNILGMFAFGDCSLRTATQNGALKTIEFADYVNLNVLGIYQKTTVIVYGK